MDMKCKKKSIEQDGKGPRKQPHSKQTSISAKQKMGVIRRLSRDCSSPSDVFLVTKWLAILGRTNKDEALARDYLLELIHHQLRESSRLSSPFTKLEGYNRELRSVLREVGRQQLRRLGLLQRQSTTKLQAPKPSRASLITHQGDHPKSLASKEAMNQIWKQKQMHQLDGLETKYRLKEKQLRGVELPSTAADAAKSKESRRPGNFKLRQRKREAPQKPPMVLTVVQKELLCRDCENGREEGKDVPTVSCRLLAERNHQYRQHRRQKILERKERELKEHNQRECEREHQRVLRAERQQKEKELLINNLVIREKEHRERSRTVQERRQHERQLIESRKEKKRRQELGPSERGDRSRKIERQLQAKLPDQKSCWLCKRKTVAAEESLDLRIHLDLCDMCQKQVRLDADVVRSCSLESQQQKLRAANTKKRAKGKGERECESQQMEELEMGKPLQKSPMMEWHRQRPLKRSSDEESSAWGKAGKDEQRPRGNLKNFESEDKQLRQQIPTAAHESQKPLKEINSRKLLKSIGRAGEERKKDLEIRGERERRESEEIKRREPYEIKNKDEADSMARKEVLKEREAMGQWLSQESIVDEGAQKRSSDQDITSPERRPQGEERETEEQLDRRREKQWDMLLKLLESEKNKRRHKSQESGNDRNYLKRKGELERNSKYDMLGRAQQGKELRPREVQERSNREKIKLLDTNGIQDRKELDRRAREKEEFDRKESEKQKLLMESQIMKACPWQEWHRLGPLKRITAGERASAEIRPQTEEEKENRRVRGRPVQGDVDMPLKSSESKENNLRRRSQVADCERNGSTWQEQSEKEQREDRRRVKEKQKIEREDLKREEENEFKRKEGMDRRSREELELEQPLEERATLRETKDMEIGSGSERISSLEKTQFESPQSILGERKLKNDLPKGETRENQLDLVLREQERIAQEGLKNREPKALERKESETKIEEQLERRAKENDRALRPQNERNITEIGELAMNRKSYLNKRNEQLPRGDTEEELKRKLRNYKHKEGTEKEELQRKEEKETKEREQLKSIATDDELELERRREREREQSEKEHELQRELKQIFMELEHKKAKEEVRVREREDPGKRCKGNEFDGRAGGDDNEEQWKKTEKEELEIVEWRVPAEEAKIRENMQTKLGDVARKDFKRNNKANLNEEMFNTRATDEFKEQLKVNEKSVRKGKNKQDTTTETEQPNKCRSQTEVDQACWENKLINHIQDRMSNQILLELNQNVARSQRFSGRCLAALPVESEYKKSVHFHRNCDGPTQRQTKRTAQPLPRTHPSPRGHADQAQAEPYIEGKTKICSGSETRSSSSPEYFAPRPSISQSERWVRFMETDEGTSLSVTATRADAQKRPEAGKISGKSGVSHSSNCTKKISFSPEGRFCPQQKTYVMEQPSHSRGLSPSPNENAVSYCTQTGRKRFRPELVRYQLNRRKGPSQHQGRHVRCPMLLTKGKANENPESLCQRLQSDNALMERKLAEARTRTRERHIGESMMRRAADVVKLFRLGMRNKEPKEEETSWTEHFGDAARDGHHAPYSTSFDLAACKLRKIIHRESLREVKLPGRIFRTMSKAVNRRGGQLMLPDSLLKCIDTLDASLEELLRRVLNSQFEVQHFPDLLQMAEKLADQKRSAETISLEETGRTTEKCHQLHWKQLSNHFIGLLQQSFNDHCNVADDQAQDAFETVLRSYTGWSSRRLKSAQRFKFIP